jgi:hypothetical protein
LGKSEEATVKEEYKRLKHNNAAPVEVLLAPLPVVDDDPEHLPVKSADEGHGELPARNYEKTTQAVRYM